jgi:hypothetical protein
MAHIGNNAVAKAVARSVPLNAEMELLGESVFTAAVKGSVPAALQRLRLIVGFDHGFGERGPGFA